MTATGKPDRYTAPIPQAERVSPPWMGGLIVALLVLGVLVIIIDYLGVLPGGATNWYLAVGAGMIIGGILTATRYH
jgi:hypothetical protein